jgi:hypothetical protein
MKHQEGFHFLFVLLLLASNALAQSGDSQAANDLLNNDLPRQVAVARCAYNETEDACAGVNPSSAEARGPNGDAMLAQLPRRMPGPPMQPRRPTMGRPRGAYPGVWMEEGSGRHAAIGALIGFGLGAALGAHANKDQHPGVGVRAAVLVGTIGAVLGAAVGYNTPSFRARSPYRRGPWTDEDEQASRPKPAEPDSVGQTSAQAPAPKRLSSQPAAITDDPGLSTVSAR